MKNLTLFGCHDFYIGGKIVTIISTLENLLKILLSVIFLTWASQESKSLHLEKGN